MLDVDCMFVFFLFFIVRPKNVTTKINKRHFRGEPSADFAKNILQKYITQSAPESRLLTRLCPNLIQFFLVTVPMLPENFVTIRALVLEIYC